MISGYPADYTREWAAIGKANGTTLTLTWSTARTLSSVRLYDRPNTSDPDHRRNTHLLQRHRHRRALPRQRRRRDHRHLRPTQHHQRALHRHLHQQHHHQPRPRRNPGIRVHHAPTCAHTDSHPDPHGHPDTHRDTDPDADSDSHAHPDTDTHGHADTHTDGDNRRTWPARPAWPRARRTPPRPGQTAAKAIDGVISGYPADYTREWAAIGKANGTTLTHHLEHRTHPAARSASTDRPDTSDRITGGTLTFSNGTVIAVPSLDNAGAATIVAPSPHAAPPACASPSPPPAAPPPTSASPKSRHTGTPRPRRHPPRPRPTAPRGVMTASLYFAEHPGELPPTPSTNWARRRKRRPKRSGSAPEVVVAFAGGPGGRCHARPRDGDDRSAAVMPPSA